eukprot:scaffold30653_cov32-Phaeocystis_antarctica.AAC.1
MSCSEWHAAGRQPHASQGVTAEAERTEDGSTGHHKHLRDHRCGATSLFDEEAAAGATSTPMADARNGRPRAGSVLVSVRAVTATAAGGGSRPGCSIENAARGPWRRPSEGSQAVVGVSGARQVAITLKTEVRLTRRKLFKGQF